MENTEIVIKNEVGIEMLISRAIDKQVSVETMEKLLAMRTELLNEKRKKNYDTALSSFQSECPVIEKTKHVYNKDGRTVRYSYAPLEEIVKQIKSLLQKYGFSYSINTLHEKDFMTITCRATHCEGHSEESIFKVCIERDAFMNDSQKIASASTFGKRYAFCNVFGILTGDEDDDSISSATEITLEPQLPKEWEPKETTKPLSEKEKLVKEIGKIWASIKPDVEIWCTLLQMEHGVRSAKVLDEETAKKLLNNLELKIKLFQEKAKKNIDSELWNAMLTEEYHTQKLYELDEKKLTEFFERLTKGEKT